MKRGGITMLTLILGGMRVVIRMGRPTKSPRLNALTTASQYRVQILIALRYIDVKLTLKLDEPVTSETSIDTTRQFRSFHGGNRGSNPRGDAKPTDHFPVRIYSRLRLVPNSCQRSVATSARDPLSSARTIRTTKPTRPKLLVDTSANPRRAES